MLQVLADRWWVVLLRGILALGAGIATFVSPQITLEVIVLLVGLSALIDGLGCMFMGVGGGAEGRPWWEMILLGLLGVAFGVIAIVQPAFVGLILLAMVAGWAIARGVMEIVVAIRLRKMIENEWMIALSGALSIGCGVLLIAYPLAGALAIAMVIGTFLLLIGAAAIAFSFRLKGLRNRLRGAA